MKIIQFAEQLGKELDTMRAQGKTIGFVPTMGALHAGHISLVEAAKQNSHTVVVSIFVNPTQFNNKKDLEKYPRTPQADTLMLQQAAVDVLYMPSVNDVYPEVKPTPLGLDFGQLDKVMEGKFRQGHFEGVAKVVHRLFEIVQPNKAFFGEKDFQQLAIIREMVRLMQCPVQIIACPIMREPDGLAMSSRNTRLRREERAAAPIIIRALEEARELAKIRPPKKVIEYVEQRFRNDDDLKLEYFEIVDAQTLQPVESWQNPNGIVACIAAWAGEVRLIDNMKF